MFPLDNLLTPSWLITLAVLSVDLLVRLILVGYIPKNRKPTAAAAWLLLISVLPVFGTILFFIIGNTKYSRKRRAKQDLVTKSTRKYTQFINKKGLAADMPNNYKPHADLVEALTGFASTKNNSIEILTNYEKIIDQITSSIDRSKKYVYVQFFTLCLDETTEKFFTALENAIGRGVSVHIMFDYLGSRKYKSYKEMKQRLDDMGADWCPALPFTLRPSKYNRPDLRNHRKIIVVDSDIAFIGSLNMIDKTYHRKDDISYLELVARFSGPVVNEASIIFAGDWFFETGKVLVDFVENTNTSVKSNVPMQIIPSGPGYRYENNLLFFVSIISTAKKSVLITNPYLVPSEPLLTALTAASIRGVKVSILNSEAMDQWMVGHAQRSYYEELLRAGVNIHLYKKPYLVHEKYISVDNEIAVVGSSNLDIRSFALNDECTLVAYDSKTASTLTKHHQDMLKNSTQLSLKAWLSRPVRKTLLDSIARLTSALQ